MKEIDILNQYQSEFGMEAIPYEENYLNVRQAFAYLKAHVPTDILNSWSVDASLLAQHFGDREVFPDSESKEKKEKVRMRHGKAWLILNQEEPEECHIGYPWNLR